MKSSRYKSPSDFEKLFSESHLDYLLIVPYQDHWQWLLIIEMAESLSVNSNRVVVVSLDAVNRNFLKRRLFAIFGYHGINPKIIDELRKSSIEVFLTTPLGVMFEELKNRTSQVWSNKELETILYSHLVDRTQSLDTQTVKAKRTSKKLRREVSVILNCLSGMNIPPTATLVTPNGRYARNKAVIEFAKKNNLNFRVIDTASPGKYLLMQNAQSIEEGANTVWTHWNNGHPIKRVEIGHRFFKDRISKIKTSNDVWTSEMKIGFIPRMDKTKKICVFYTTTQIEFAGTESDIQSGAFGSQVEAIMATRKKLNKEEWDIYVRRHPKKAGTKNTSDDLIQGLYEIPGITIIEPHSGVDSYELAKQADLVLHFGSQIGAELTYMESAPVYALNKTSWWKFDEPHHLFMKSDWENFDLSHISFAEKHSVLPLGYFALTGGNEFEHLSQDKLGNWVYKNVAIKLNLTSWVKDLLKLNDPES